MSERVYLAGAIEAAPDNGMTWRAEITPKLKQLGLEVFNPCTQSDSKIYQKVFGQINPNERIDWPKIKRTQWHLFVQAMTDIVQVDLSEVIKSDLVYVRWDQYVMKGAGTIGEITVSAFVKKPIILELAPGIVLTDLPGWVVGCVSRIFESETTALSWLGQRNLALNYREDEELSIRW